VPPRRPLVCQPSFGRQRVAHGLVDLRAPYAKTGLGHVCQHSLPACRLSPGGVEGIRDEKAAMSSKVRMRRSPPGALALTLIGSNLNSPIESPAPG
jgi:hypothetical protein